METGELEIVQWEERSIAADMIERVMGIEVKTSDDYSAAGEFLKIIKTTQKRIEDAFAPTIKSAHAAHRAAISMKDEAIEPANRAEIVLKGKMSTWYRAEESRKIEIARREAEEIRKIEEQERLERAVELEEQGKKQEAEALIEKPVEAPKVKPMPVAPQVSGVQARKVWRFEIIDSDKMVRDFMIPNERLIGETVRQNGEAAVKMIGEGSIRIWQETQIASGRA